MIDPLALLEMTIADWATRRDDVGAIVVVGSRARYTHPADVWSDLDLIVFTTTPEAYTAGAGWLDAWGQVWAPALSQIEGGLPEWLALMSGGLKVDVVLAPAASALPEMLARFPFQDVLGRGLRVLVDKTASHGHPPPSFAPAPPLLPTAFEFQNACFAFLVAVDKTARLLRRGEVWRAKILFDADLKLRLLAFVEWQARAAHGPGHDTWYEGRFLHEWADPSLLPALPATFAAYDRADLWRALWATMALFQRLAADCAEKWGLPYPASAAERLLAQWGEPQGRQEIRSSTQP